MGLEGQTGLFFGLSEVMAPEAACRGLPRLRLPIRNQIAVHWLTLDELLPPDHRARQVWSLVEQLDLSALYRAIKATEGRPGHPPGDPRLLVALWLYATLEQVGSARLLERLCREHLAFRWMCGGVRVNYHTLSDFRVAHPAILEDLLTRSFAACLDCGLASLERVAQDGVRVRANAGAASFRRRQRLEEYRELARTELARLRAEVHADPAAGTRRQRAAQERAARDREARVAAALQAVESLADHPPNHTAEAPPPQEPPPQEPASHGPEARPPEPPASPSRARSKPPRASTTDAEARVMKMADGGFRPAFNVQFATATDSQLIAAVAIGNIGSDQGQLAPMVERLAARYGQPPGAILVDGGFTKLADIEAVSANGQTTVYAPVTKPRDPERDPHAPRRGDTPKVAAWRGRMATPEAKTIYKDRAATAECVNALARNRGLQRFLVRGLVKAKAVALWFALAHNLARVIGLRAATS
jgi:transposase